MSASKRGRRSGQRSARLRIFNVATCSRPRSAPVIRAPLATHPRQAGRTRRSILPPPRLDPDPARRAARPRGGRSPDRGRSPAGLGAKPGSIDLVETLEDAVAGRPRDADPVVFDRRLDLVRRRRRPDRDLATVRAELDRVVHEVHDDLPEAGGVAPHPWQARRRVEPECHPLAFREEAQALGGIRGETAHVDIVGHLQRAAALDPAEVEELVDHLDQVPGLDLDLGDALAHLGRDDSPTASASRSSVSARRLTVVSGVRIRATGCR